MSSCIFVAALALGAAGPADEAAVALGSGTAALAEKRWGEAVAQYQKAGVLAMDRGGLRARALSGRLRAAKQGGLGAEVLAVRRLMAADGALAGGRDRRALEEAARVFEEDGDLVRAAWARAFVALSLAGARKDLEEGKALAKELLSSVPPLPPHVRWVALQAGLRAAVLEKDAAAEASHALQLDTIRYASLSPEKRRYTRSAQTASACARYEKKAGAGKCAALAKLATGEFRFVDHSRLRRKKLSDADITAAQAQYLTVIDHCLRTAAAADERNTTMFEDAELTLSWSIDRSGRATTPSIHPTRYDRLAGDCIRTHVAWFRYPRHQDPDLPHVTLPFHLTVEEHATANP